MIIKNLNIALISTVIAIIKIYQLIFSPILKQNCRYLPTCSEYSIRSFEEYGFFKGLYYSLKRISQYEQLLINISSIINYSSERLKQIDAKGTFESDDEIGYFFEEVKKLQEMMNDVFENTEGEKNE